MTLFKDKRQGYKFKDKRLENHSEAVLLKFLKICPKYDFFLKSLFRARLKNHENHEIYLG